MDCFFCLSVPFFWCSASSQVTYPANRRVGKSQGDGSWVLTGEQHSRGAMERWVSESGTGFSGAGLPAVGRLCPLLAPRGPGGTIALDPPHAVHSPHCHACSGPGQGRPNPAGANHLGAASRPGFRCRPGDAGKHQEVWGVGSLGHCLSWDWALQGPLTVNAAEQRHRGSHSQPGGL